MKNISSKNLIDIQKLAPIARNAGKLIMNNLNVKLKLNQMVLPLQLLIKKLTNLFTII